MKTNLLLLFLFLTNLLQAQFGPKHLLNNCELCSPKEIEVADVDGDQLLDLIVLSTDANDIYWYKNLGSFQFSEAHLLAENVYNFLSFSISDINNDGFVDVIGGSWRSNTIYWFENMQDGTFIRRTISTSNKAIDVFSADLDNDGDLDVLAASQKDDDFFWFENQDNGNIWEAHLIANDIDAPLSVHADDVNGDGKIDVFCSAKDGNTVMLYLNNGDGNFESSQILNDDDINQLSIFTGDLNNNGNIDVLSNGNNGKIHWYENMGDNNFVKKDFPVLGLFGIKTAIVLDVNEDGYNDLLPAANLEEIFHWYQNDKQNDYIETVFPTNNQAGITDISIGDLDNDGDIDITAISNLGDRIMVFQNNGNGNFNEINSFKDLPSDIQALRTGDIDNDGDLDIIHYSLGDKKIGLSENLGDGVFKENVIVIEKDVYTRFNFNGSGGINGGNAMKIFHLADINNDELLDIVMINEKRNLIWFRNNGNKQFTGPQIIDSSNRARAFHYGDLDGDNDLDIITAPATYQERIIWYKNSNDGLNWEKIEWPNSPGLGSFMHTTDLDGDEDFDILAVSDEEPQIIWFENDGTGNFGASKIIASPGEVPWRLIVNDLNGDRKPDILAEYYNQQKVVWHINEGPNGFSDENIITNSIRNPFELGIIDLNGDGNQDVLTKTNGVRTLYWHKNLGNNQFQKGTELALKDIRNINIISSADLDKDGDIELLGTARYNDEIFWYENLLNFPSISGIVFWDEDENGLRDSSERLLSNIPISISPNPLSTFTDGNGIFRFYTEKDKAYTISVSPDSCWQITTDSLKQFTLFGNVSSGLNFGFKLVSDFQVAKPRIISNFTRCGFDVSFFLSVQNDGCAPIKGKYGLVLDSLVSLVYSGLEPIEIRGDTLFWNFEELIASETQEVPLIFQMPNAEFIGEYVQLEALAYIENENKELELSNTYEFKSEIRCAYDPNDKLVTPNRLANYDENYTLFGEPLEYTIRFQNTGNDTAFNVIIRDTLDPHLDWSTFKTIFASHPYEAFLYKDGQVEFSFKNIMLPDSTINEPKSHGYVTYKILPKKDLPENTVIDNTASIYFDFNAPITTNTTRNVLVSELPKTTAINDLTLKQLVKIYPNPFNNFLTIEQKFHQVDESLRLSIFDLTGRQVQSSILKEGTQLISTAQLANGLYIYQIVNKNGQMIMTGKIIKH